ncbi:hypothetical protein CSE16_02610 [Solibacillus sp. R5-41]|uniref:stalk domain-containing protein n=1 Tax=Solibacillus sp. R5-41 TaxID=2048654 RepID=UPI000C128E6C|nr:stalk domain-containing protein [Solibacillus sp. R5-41]ATP39000.1 hypothetical protein CSE16_02610 [Solibacillus sp. R5-41]
MKNKLLGKVSKGLASTIVASLLVFSQTGVSEAAEVTKKVEINPQIKILNNGYSVTGNVAPIIIDGTTYLPVRSLSTVLNKNVLWDGMTKSIFITDTVDPNESKNEIANLERFIKTKDAKISELENSIKSKDTKVAELENLGKTKDAKILELENAIKAKDAKIAELEKNSNTNAPLKDLQKQLNRKYQYSNGLDFNIILKEDKYGINVEIEIDLKYATADKDWYRLSDADFLKFINLIMDDIWYEYRNTEITGIVINIDDNKTLATFSGNNRYLVKFDKFTKPKY